MRISTLQMHISMSGSMQKAAGDVNKTLTQMSSGKKILQPSDDLFASVQIRNLQQRHSKLEIWAGNIERSSSFLNSQEVTLKDINNNIDRARDLVLSAGNGTMNERDLKALATELKQVLVTITDLSNTRSASGEHLFSGTKGDKAPLAQVAKLDSNGKPLKGADGKVVKEWQYIGSDSVRSLPVSDSQQARFGITAKGFASFANDMNTFVKTLENIDGAGNREKLSQSIKSMIGSTDALSATVNQGLTSIGAQLNTLKAAAASNKDLQMANKAMHDSLEKLDMAEAVTRLSIEKTILQATQKSYAQASRLSLFDII